MSRKEKNGHLGSRVVEALDLDNFAMDMTHLEDLVQMLLVRCKERLTFEVLLCCPYGMDEAERFSIIYMDGVPVATEYYNMRWADNPLIRPSYYVGPKTSGKNDDNRVCDMVFIEENLRNSVPETQVSVDGNGRCANSEGEVFFCLTNMARHQSELVWDCLSNAASNQVIREVRTVYRQKLHEAPTRFKSCGMGQIPVQLTDEWIKVAKAH